VGVGHGLKKMRYSMIGLWMKDGRRCCCCLREFHYWRPCAEISELPLFLACGFLPPLASIASLLH